MKPSFVFAVAALVAACAPPLPDPALGVLKVAIGPSLDGVYDWRHDQRDALARELRELAALGPEFRLVAEGEADVVVRAADLSASGACGHFNTSEAFVEVDAACAAGLSGLARAAGHELVHYLTWTRWHSVDHLCDWPLGAPVPAGCNATHRCVGGDCLMSPGLHAVDATDPSFDEAYSGDFVDPTPAAADVAFVHDCHAAGRCD